MLINKYFNKKINDVSVLYLMYLISAPLAKIFILLKITPNIITTLSNISALASYIFIFYNFYLFSFFWILSLVLDICDGTVARATKQSNAFGSFYDHYSDVLKIFVLYFIIAIFYDTSIIWILISLNMISFSSVDYLDGVCGKKEIIIKNYKNNLKRTHFTDETTTGNFVKTLLVFYRKITQTFIYKTLFVMHGQYNLILIPLAFNQMTCIYTLVLTLIITLWSSITMIDYINKQNRLMMIYNIPWK